MKHVHSNGFARGQKAGRLKAAQTV